MNKQQFYTELLQDMSVLLEGETHFIAVLANASALLYKRLEGVHSAGFYLLEGDILVLGLFQGKVVCVRIPLSKGVCGTAAAENRIQRIGDVRAFQAIFACDAASNAEIVLRITMDDTRGRVLDIDSTIYQRFDQDDEDGLKAMVDYFCRQLGTTNMHEFITNT